MKQEPPLPESHVRLIRSLEASYLEHEDPILQSGFGGGALRWKAEREPILHAVRSDGDFLDIGCANGYLLECLVEWGRDRGVSLIPHGLDIGSQLIDLAKKRLPQFEDNFHVGNSWDWEPPREYRYVYTIHDCVPVEWLPRYINRLLLHVVEPGGRLIVGAYGSRSQGLPPFDVVSFLASLGHRIEGSGEGGDPAMASFAWTDRPDNELAGA